MYNRPTYRNAQAFVDRLDAEIAEENARVARVTALVQAIADMLDFEDHILDDWDRETLAKAKHLADRLHETW